LSSRAKRIVARRIDGIRKTPPIVGVRFLSVSRQIFASSALSSFSESWKPSAVSLRITRGPSHMQSANANAAASAARKVVYWKSRAPG